MAVVVSKIFAIQLALFSASPARVGDPRCWEGFEDDRRRACCSDAMAFLQLSCGKKPFGFERCCFDVGNSGASCTRSQSQFGEELSVIQLLGWQMKRDGIYVEMGALDGVTYSNTLALRTCLGWTGMLIEGSPRHFQRLHQNYKDVESVIIKYGAVCAPPLTNATFSQGMSIGSIDGDVTYLPTGLRKRFSYRRQRVVVPCRPMEWYLQQLPKKHVDFVSLDVEGAELEVLLTMDFTEVLVEVFLIELHDWGRSEQTQSWKIRKLMRNLGYKECTNVHVWPNGLFVLQEGPYSSRCS